MFLILILMVAIDSRRESETSVVMVLVVMPTFGITTEDLA